MSEKTAAIDYEKYIVLILVAISCIIRFHGIGSPSVVVFDEVHFGGFVSNYVKHVFFQDVHPPLGKLLLTLAAVMGGYDGSFSFKEIGLEYGENVPFVHMRLFPAVFGVFLVPIAYLTLRNLKCSKTSSVVGASLVMLDNALVIQSRFIFLDSFLIFFIAASAWSYTEFLKYKNNPFSARWWKNLALTGAFIGLASSVKWVGVFSVAFVGIFTVKELWDLACNSTVSVKALFRHFLARFACLLVLPAVIYIATFYVHFKMASKGDLEIGSSKMSPSFIAGLGGQKVIPDTFKQVAYGSKIYLRHHATSGGFLHSHLQYYPTGSKQQQITCYGFRDENSLFEILYPLRLDNETLVEDKIEGFIRVKDGETIRLKHVPTGKKLHSHNVRAPVSDKKGINEVSAYGDPNNPNFLGDFNDHWKVEIMNKDPENPYLDAVKSKFNLIHTSTGCRLYSHDVKLPDWGFKQQEVVCAGYAKDEISLWRIDHNEHPQIPSNATKINYRKASFSEMIIELHKKMWKDNKSIKGNHPYKSHPLTWPVLERGISYWKSVTGNSQIYFLGNPVIWWLSTKAFVFYLGAFIVVNILAQRSIKGSMFQQISGSSGFLFVGWAVHYIPFFFMGREVYLHHYLPAFYFLILLFTTFFDFAITSASQSRKMITSFFLILIVFWSFTTFYPITYGNKMTDDKCKSLKWKKKWDINCGTDAVENLFVRPTPVQFADDSTEEVEVVFNEEEEEE